MVSLHRIVPPTPRWSPTLKCMLREHRGHDGRRRIQATRLSIYVGCAKCGNTASMLARPSTSNSFIHCQLGLPDQLHYRQQDLPVLGQKAGQGLGIILADRVIWFPHSGSLLPTEDFRPILENWVREPPPHLQQKCGHPRGKPRRVRLVTKRETLISWYILHEHPIVTFPAI